MADLYFLTQSSHAKNGSALIYILVAIALLGALTASVVGSSGMQSDAQRAEKLKMELQAQITMISNAINECVSLYPNGDPTIVPGAGGISAEYTHPYPIRAMNSHYTGSTLGTAGTGDVKTLRCPGNPGVDHNHEPLFDGSSGRQFPLIPSPLWDWYYRNASHTHQGQYVEGVQIYAGTYAGTTDPYIWKAFEMLDDEYPECQLDIIEGDGTNGCANGQKCIRYWFVRRAPTCP